MKRVYNGDGIVVVDLPSYERLSYNLATHTTIVEICGDDDLMQEMYDYCKEKKIVGYDTETTGLNFFKDRIVLAQIGDHDRQYLIWLDKTNPDLLLKVLRDPDVVKVGLNLKFDLTFGLWQYGFEEARAQNVVDVMLTAQILMCGIYDNVGLTMKMSSMATQAKHWLGLQIPKDPELRIGWENWDPVDFEKRIKEFKVLGDFKAVKALEKQRADKILYAADDVCIPISLAYKHKPWIQHLDLKYIVNMENRFLPVISDIEARGLPFNPDKWLELTLIAEQGTKDARQVLDELFDVEITVVIDQDGHAHNLRDKNYTSNDQIVNLIREWMWTNCGIEVVATNQHFKEALTRAGMPAARLDMMFRPMEFPDPKNPKKKKKRGYPKMKDLVAESWGLNKHRLPPGSFVLDSTDSKLMKFYKIIYEAAPEIIAKDAADLPTTFGLPAALVDPILNLRGYSKSASTYGRNWLNSLGEDGRVYTNFRQAALSTGRLSSTPNTMNFPADAAYRACFEAQPGFKIVGSDYSQVEPRVIAELSKDPTYMRVFWSELPDSQGFKRWCDVTVLEELDLYTEVGKEIGQIPPHYSKVDTKGDDAKPDGISGRKQAKIANLGLGYGTGKNKFHFMLCIDTGEYHSRHETDGLYQTYWAAFGAMKKYLDSSSAMTDPKKTDQRKVAHPYVFAEEVTWAETISGRKRFFRSNNPTWWTQGRNMPIQGTAGGDMLKMAAMELTEWAWENNIEGGLVNLIHDELLAEVREDQAEEFSEMMQECMERVGQTLCPSVPIVAETYIEDFWRK